MVFGSVTKSVFKKIHAEAKKEAKGEKRNTYRAKCPNCGKQLVKESLLEEGCFVCGWQQRRGIKNGC